MPTLCWDFVWHEFPQILFMLLRSLQVNMYSCPAVLIKLFFWSHLAQITYCYPHRPVCLSIIIGKVSLGVRWQLTQRSTTYTRACMVFSPKRMFISPPLAHGSQSFARVAQTAYKSERWQMCLRFTWSKKRQILYIQKRKTYWFVWKFHKNKIMVQLQNLLNFVTFILILCQHFKLYSLRIFMYIEHDIFVMFPVMLK